MGSLSSNLHRLAGWLPLAVPGYVAGAAVLAFLLQPWVRFLPSNAVIGGIVLTIWLGDLFAARAANDHTRIASRLGLGAGALALLSYSFGEAGNDAVSNDRRCLAIQRDMLSAHPRKPDGPALFQAFGCRPQGEGSVMVAPTEAELLAARYKER